MKSFIAMQDIISPLQLLQYFNNYMEW